MTAALQVRNAQEFAAAFLVPHTIMVKLELYEKLLLQWQKAVNLVAPDSLADAWQRHFADSAQLLPLAPHAKTWVDLGSGAGFPGLVIAILLANQKDCTVHLIESNSRKCAFLAEVARQTGAPVKIHNARIGDAAKSGAVPVANIVTARALAPLDELLGLALPFSGDASFGLFFKGREADAEVAAARKRWEFNATTHRSLSGTDGKILAINGLRPKHGGGQ
jgi:16S rRNA (guanine527-N7)-methyltransferase